MKSKLIKLLITGLTIALMIISLTTYKTFKDKSKSVMADNKPQQEQQMRIISKETVIDKLNLENSLNCYSGEIGIQATYSNKNISDDDANFKWMKNKLSGKTLDVNSKYKFNFTYDLKDLKVSIYNNTIIIQLSNNRLSMNQCELLDTQTKEETGWFTSFTASEINSINDRTQKLAKNRIQSDKKLRSEAMNNVQSDIKALLESVKGNSTNIEFQLDNYDVIENNDANIR